MLILLERNNWIPTSVTLSFVINYPGERNQGIKQWEHHIFWLSGEDVSENESICILQCT